MGFWHDYGVIDFSFFFERGRNGDVKFPDRPVDRSEHLFYTET